MRPNKGMKLTKLSAAWLPEWTCRLMPALVNGMDAGTASQLIPGVRPAMWSMDIPAAAIRAYGPVLDDLESVPSDATAVCAFGRSKGLALLRSLAGLQRLWLSGVVERVWSTVQSLSLLRELVIHDYRAASLAVMPEFPALEVLALSGSPKLRSLDGLQRYGQLRQLILFDCCNYGDLRPLRTLSRLDTLCLEGGFSKQLRVDSLEPLSGLVRLKRLRLASIRVGDRSLRPLASLRKLESVFIARTFPANELRHLADALPGARGEYLDSARRHEAG